MNANCDTPQNSDSRSHTENRILKAAEAEFLAKGYAGARTTAIAEAAGVTHAMLHYYFRTKDKLFERILNEKNTAGARHHAFRDRRSGAPA